jgi:hypothetical protein
MEKTIQLFLPKFLFAFCLLAFAAIPLSSLGQSAGDVAFTGFNGDGDNDFAIVALADIPANTTIYFTDTEWNGKSFESGEDDITWTTGSSVISAGTVVTFTDINSASEMVSTGSITAGNMSLGVSDEAIFAYLGAERSPTTFLAAVSTSIDQYDGTSPNPSGTLEGTGLSQGTTAILLSDNIDVAEYIGDRSGNTKSGYLDFLNVINGETATDDNWEQTGGSGDQEGQILPFDDTNFVIVNPPTIAFTTSSATGAEGSSTTVTVELVESDNTAVDVDVVFLSGSSEADDSDIDNYTTQMVSFTSGDASGATRDVTVTLTNDSNFEGDEIAVFQLQDNTTGSIIDPDVFNLTITDDDAPAIVFNEINADPGDDANGDGTVDTDTDEFIEWVNNSGQDIDISGWTYNDGSSASFTFPDGAVIGAGNAVVLFDNTGGVQPQGNFGAAFVYTDAEIGLNNSSETLSLFDADGNLVVSTTYPNEAADQSNNLSPDGTGTSYVDHSILSPTNALSSPGTQVNGNTWGNGTYAIAFRGSEGYRFVSTPAQNTSFSDLFANLWTQGVTGSDAPSAGANIFAWQESGGGAFNPAADMSNNLETGRGYIIYVFEDDDFRSPGVQGGFPKIVNTDNAENTSPVSVAVTSNDDNSSAGIDGYEGFNLLGNPYGTDVSVTAVIDALEVVNSNVNANISVWDHEAGSGNGGYINLNDGDQLAPFQAYFMRYFADGVNGNASFNRSDLAANQGTEFFKGLGQVLEFEMYLGDGDKFDTYKVNFSENGTIGEDRYDAYKLFSLKSNAIGFYSTVGQDVKLAKNVLPTIESLEGELRVALTADVPSSGEYTFSWSELQEIPEDVELYLVDNETNRKIDIRSAEEFSFNANVSANRSTDKQPNEAESPSPFKSNNNAPAVESRFELVIVKPGSPDNNNEEELEQAVVLSPNYPNPFRSETTMNLELRESMHVTMEVYNIVGQKVATMVDQTMSDGSHEMSWTVPANMPSGIYLVKMEAGSTVMTRKMTLVK